MAGGPLRLLVLAALSSSVFVIASDDDEKKAEEGDAAAFEGVDNPEADIHERLVMAAFDGRDEDVEALINEGAPLDKRHTDGVTALFMAAQNGNTRSVRYLLEAGANVDRARQTDRTTPLMRAAYNGHTRVAQQLVDAGADMAKKDKNGANTAACFLTRLPAFHTAGGVSQATPPSRPPCTRSTPRSSRSWRTPARGPTHRGRARPRRRQRRRRRRGRRRRRRRRSRGRRGRRRRRSTMAGACPPSALPLTCRPAAAG